jgi:hypothetical protein
VFGGVSTDVGYAISTRGLDAEGGAGRTERGWVSRSLAVIVGEITRVEVPRVVEEAIVEPEWGKEPRTETMMQRTIVVVRTAVMLQMERQYFNVFDVAFRWVAGMAWERVVPGDGSLDRIVIPID